MPGRELAGLGTVRDGGAWMSILAPGPFLRPFSKFTLEAVGEVLKEGCPQEFSCLDFPSCVVGLKRMMGELRTLDRRLLVRRCVECGYDGPQVRDDLLNQADLCPHCGCDLRRRPPRSYAEMEGLLGLSMVVEPPTKRESVEERLIHRWLAFLFFALMGMVAIAYLSAAAMPV